MTVKTKGNASRYITGIGKATSFGVVKGKTSTGVLAAQPVLYFVYRVESNSISPKDVITNRHQFYLNASDWFVRHKPQHSPDQCLHWLEREGKLYVIIILIPVYYDTTGSFQSIQKWQQGNADCFGQHVSSTSNEVVYLDFVAKKC